MIYPYFKWYFCKANLATNWGGNTRNESSFIKDYIGGHSVNMLVHDIDNFNVNFSFTTVLGEKDAAYYFENILPHDDINEIYENITPSFF